MNTTRILIGGLLLVITLLSGVWLSHLGKPWNGVVFTLHKLVAVGTVLLLGNMIYRLQQNAGIGAPGSAAIIVSGLLVLSLFISGALLSIGKPAIPALLTVHRVVPWLAAVSTAATTYLLAASSVR